MFTIQGLSYAVIDQYTKEERHLLHQINWTVQAGQFVAILGPSGCGKSTLVRCLLGVHEPSAGRILLDGHDLSVHSDFFIPEIGYVPQFSIAHDDLTALEVLEYSAHLRLPVGLGADEKNKKIIDAINQVELSHALHTRVVHLSGGQKRRLSLAMELLKDPPVLIMDEVTSGLDAESEKKFMDLFRRLARDHGKTIICVTHHVENIATCDEVLVLNKGQKAFAGTPEDMLAYYEMETPMHLYSRLSVTPSQADVTYEEAPKPGSQFHFSPPPNAFYQWTVLISRQFKLFFRAPSQVILHAILMLGFPCLVVVFAMKGLPEVKNLTLDMNSSMSMESFRSQAEITVERVGISTLASGLIMFQIILLTLMGSNNSAREIVKERVILEKEKLSGLSPGAYIMSKAAFITVLSLLQAAVMLYMVKLFCRFPGDTAMQYGILAGATLSMSFICLFFSAFFRTTEQASLVSIYVVGLQLPLSGAVLALPTWLLWFTRPFIDAYWGWSGYIKTMVNSRIYDVIVEHSDTYLAPPEYAFGVFLLHIVVATIAAYFGVRRRHNVM